MNVKSSLNERKYYPIYYPNKANMYKVKIIIKILRMWLNKHNGYFYLIKYPRITFILEFVNIKIQIKLKNKGFFHAEEIIYNY